jgi:prolipoprotein diacylglyceryltransferase
VPPAVLTVTFDPVLRLSDTSSVRIETIALAIVLFLGLVLAARIGSLTPTIGPYVPAPGLRVDDLVFIVVGAVPGAIFGGRLGYALDHLDYYRANPAAVLDPAQGSLTLTLAVPFGILTGGVIARLLGAPVGRWMHALALPLLFMLATGKLVGVLGATGQGTPSDLLWATAYGGPGPWGSLGAHVSAHPSQVYEAILVGLAIAGLWFAWRLEVVARRDGAAVFVALGLWAVARFVVAFTWRDPAVVGPLRMEQLLAIGVLLVALIGLLERARAPLHAPAESRADIGARLA